MKANDSVLSIIWKEVSVFLHTNTWMCLIYIQDKIVAKMLDGYVLTHTLELFISEVKVFIVDVMHLNMSQSFPQDR